MGTLNHGSHVSDAGPESQMDSKEIKERVFIHAASLHISLVLSAPIVQFDQALQLRDCRAVCRLETLRTERNVSLRHYAYQCFIYCL